MNWTKVHFTDMGINIKLVLFDKVLEIEMRIYEKLLRLKFFQRIFWQW